MSIGFSGRLATAAAGAVLLLGLPSAAYAADEISIDHVETVDNMVNLVLSVDGLPSGTTPDASTATVEIDGRPVEASAKVVAAGDIRRSTVLVLDASNSMSAGGKFDAAIEAVNAFLDAAPDDVAIGLVTFAGRVNQSIAPTTDHDSVRSALGQIVLKRGTSVYDGVFEGLKLAGSDGSRSLLVLSDGADTNSATTLGATSDAAQEAGVVVDVVSLAAAARADELGGLAEDTGGSVIPADREALGSVFTQQADALAHQLLVTFDKPESASGDASVAVAITADGATYQDSAFVTLGAVADTPDLVNTSSPLIGKPVMLLGVLALGLGLAGLLATVLIGATDTRSAAARRMDRYLESGTGKSSKRGKGSNAADIRGSAVALTDKVVKGDFEHRISQRLAGAGSRLTASEWLLLHAGIAVAAAVVGFVLGGPAMGVLGVGVGAFGPWFYLRFRHNRRLAAFNGQLAETLSLMAGGLQAGLSLPQSIDSVVREGNEPMASELRRVLVEQRLGVDITDALDSVGQRMASEDFQWIVMAIRIQREVGGNLAEILHTVSETLREREYLRRQVRALSAEGRLSGYILTGLPPLVFAYMTYANPEYVRVLYTTAIGWMILAVAAFMLALGSFAMSKLATVKV
jgi:tight adherence protein B